MSSMKMKAAFTAAFSPDVASVYVASERRVRRLDIVSVSDGRVRTREMWSVMLSHASDLAPDGSGRILITTDTMGKHRGLNAGDGRLLWEAEEQGEGDGGLFLDDGSFLFIDWNGVGRRLDPENGREVRGRFQIGRKVRRLQRLGQTGMLAFVQLGSAADHGDPGVSEFCAYDPETHAVDVLLQDCASKDLAASPDGTLVAAVAPVRGTKVKPAHRPQRLAIIERSTGSVLRERCFQGPEKPRGAPVWTPDSKRLICASRSGYHVLDADNLNSETLVPSRYGYEADISPDGNLVFLCDWKSPQLLRLDGLRSV